MKYTDEEMEFVETCAIMSLSGIVIKSGMFDAPAFLAKHAFKIGKEMLAERKRVEEQVVNDDNL